MIRCGESLRHRFDTAGADFLFHTADLFDLQIDAEFSKRFDVGMADLVSGLRAAAANGTYFAHNEC